MQTAPVSAPDPVLDDDQVPLEAYGDAFSSDEALFDDPSPVATAPVSSGFAAAQPVSSAPAVSSPVPMATASVSNGPVAVPGAASSTQQSAPQSQAVGSVTSIDPSGDEETQIKQILSNSFGDGIKFEELSD